MFVLTCCQTCFAGQTRHFPFRVHEVLVLLHPNVLSILATRHPKPAGKINKEKKTDFHRSEKVPSNKRKNISNGARCENACPLIRLTIECTSFLNGEQYQVSGRYTEIPH